MCQLQSQVERNVCKLDQRPRDKTEELVNAIVLRSITGNKAMARLIDLISAVQITSNKAMARLIDMSSAVPRLTPARWAMDDDTAALCVALLRTQNGIETGEQNLALVRG